MKVLLLENAILQGVRHRAGAEVELPDAVALRFCEAGLAHCEAAPAPESAEKTGQLFDSIEKLDVVEQPKAKKRAKVKK